MEYDKKMSLIAAGITLWLISAFLTWYGIAQSQEPKPIKINGIAYENYVERDGDDTLVVLIDPSLEYDDTFIEQFVFDDVNAVAWDENYLVVATQNYEETAYIKQAYVSSWFIDD